jgi:hypothetical protein
MTMMMLGEGSPHPSDRRGADAIRLLRIDFDRREVTILSIPEDLWVKTSILTGFDYNTRPAFMKSGMAGGRSGALSLWLRCNRPALLDNFVSYPTTT